MGREIYHFEQLSAAIADDWTTATTIDLGRGQVGMANIEVDNVGSTALTGFRIQLRDHKNGTWYTFLADTDFQDSSLANLLYCGTSDDSLIQALTAAADGHVHMRLNAANAMRIQAKTATTGTLTVRATVAPVLG